MADFPASDHPRIRGEHPAPHPAATRLSGSSPHTRGAPVGDDKARRPGRIIPAYAGSTGRCGSSKIGITDHPRIRGEHFALASHAMEPPGSSPHTRGAHIHVRLRNHIARIIPAYAGSTPDRAGLCETVADHPRIRGEHASWPETATRSPGSSPHTRGARGRPDRLLRRRRIIPAYAGSTPPSSLRIRSMRDHPRIRGEHYKMLVTSAAGWGSSPHTRGALPRRAFVFEA